MGRKRTIAHFKTMENLRVSCHVGTETDEHGINRQVWAIFRGDAVVSVDWQSLLRLIAKAKSNKTKRAKCGPFIVEAYLSEEPETRRRYP